jgi:hypothetical protein
VQAPLRGAGDQYSNIPRVFDEAKTCPTFSQSVSYPKKHHWIDRMNIDHPKFNHQTVRFKPDFGREQLVLPFFTAIFAPEMEKACFIQV